MTYSNVYMSEETNKDMLLGNEVHASYEKGPGDMELTVGRYRITELAYPFVRVKPAK